MNGFWKKRVPAFLLALVILASLAPAALAVDECADGDHSWTDWDQQVAPKCNEEGLETRVCTKCKKAESQPIPATKIHDYTVTKDTATCGEPGERTSVCKVCGDEKKEVSPATGAHNWKNEGSSTATCTNAGIQPQICQTCGAAQNLPVQATGHSWNSGTISTPASCTAPGVKTYTCGKCGATRTESIPLLNHSVNNATGKCTRCGLQINPAAGNITVTFKNGSTTFKTQSNITSGGKPSNPGTPSYPSPAANCSYTFKGWTAADPGTRAMYTGQALVTPANIAVTANTTYYAVYTASGTNQDVSVSAGTSSSVVGGSVLSQVNSKFSGLTGRNFTTVTFSNPSGSSYGTLYANSSRTALGSVEYAYSGGSYPVSSLYFVPGRSRGYTVRYTAKDGYSTVTGTLTLNGSSTSAASDEILLRVAPGGTVNLKISKFEEVYEKLSGGATNARYVVFDPGKDYDSFPGMLYTGSRSLSRSKLADADFYLDSRDSDTYDYDLSSLNFKADKNAKEGKELSVPFQICYRNNAYSGTLRIVIDEEGMEGDVIYRVAPGSSVSLNRGDFNSAYQDIANSSQDIRYLEFDPDDGYTTFAGKISAVGHSSFTRRELSNEQFNYSGTSYGDYAIDDLVFRADSGAKDGDTLEIPFTAFRSKDAYAEGTLRIIIDKNGSQDTVTVNVAPGGTVKLDKTAFNKVYQALSGNSKRTISAVSFYAPDSYRNFAGALFAGRDEMLLSDLTHSGTWFYYSSKSDGDYALEDMTFQADRDAKEGAGLSIPFRAYYDNDRDEYEEGTLRINVTSSANTITYEAAPGSSVSFTVEDFNKAYQAISGSSRTIRYVAFEANSDYASFAGNLYTGNTQLTRSSLAYNQTQFYYSSTNFGTYALSSLSFRPDTGAKDQSTLSIPFRAYYDSSDYAQGTLKLVVNTNAGGDVAFTVTPGQTVNFDRTKFDDFFRKSYSSSSLDYIVFDVPGTADFPDSYGTLYTGYNTSYSYSFSRNGLRDVRFYYNAGDAGQGDYALNDLTFAAASSFLSGKVTLRFTAYGANDREVEGTLVIIPATASASSNYVGSVRYAVTTGTNVQINANDLSRFYKASYPSSTLQYVILGDVPAAGALYYNYYSASRYGTSAREQITAANRSRNFYLSPASPSEYALTELTYVPSGSNYCASIPFTAYGTGGQSVSGSILISVTNKAVSEVYGPTPKNTAVTFPAPSIIAAVSTATGAVPSGIQLLKLPAANVGTIYVGSGTSTPANTTTVYGYNTGNQQLSQLRFVPQSNYTGPVEIPYVALNANGAAIASGVFSMGVLNTNKKFGDITAATWCYKYVTELADAAVIDGYRDGSFKPDSTITYGAALKLIMLAAGYSEQAPTPGGGTFSGYLAKAQADGLITRSNVNLSGPITRLQVAQLAAGALKLDINNLSSVKPFTDTADVYVQALNAAGIVEGYFSNGTSTFRPSNTLTRGQVSAIVWRMQNYSRRG